jgi:hypothetical protein
VVVLAGLFAELAYIGYTGLAESTQCADLTNPQGYDSLIGVVQGHEPTAATDDDIVYTGTVNRKTAIDYCLARPKSASTPDEMVLCVATLTGSATMAIELKVHRDVGSGAYLKAKPLPRPVQNLSVLGDCVPAEMNQIRPDYPRGDTASSPDGQQIDDPNGSSFVQNDLPRLRRGYSKANPPETVWNLDVTPLP